MFNKEEELILVIKVIMKSRRVEEKSCLMFQRLMRENQRK